ncbi:MAG: hypothetical protein KDA46_03350 [Parvularculaceae bacterium]|nr:hypothetical protein [Parvularculaceae bacterium]
MKIFSVVFVSILAVSAPSHAQDLRAKLNAIKTAACETNAKYEHHGLKLGMSENEVEKLGAEPVKVNFPSSGSSSVLVEDKTYIMWSTPAAPDQPLYRIDYERGAKSPFTLEEAQAFVQERINAFGEPKIKGEGKSFLDAGYPTLNYSADQAVMNEKFQPVSACMRQGRQISPYEQMALKNFTPRTFMSGLEALQAHCPDQLDAYFDYMTYSLQPVVNVTTGQAKFRVDMLCPADRKIDAILNAPDTNGRANR